MTTIDLIELGEIDTKEIGIDTFDLDILISEVVFWFRQNTHNVVLNSR